MSNASTRHYIALIRRLVHSSSIETRKFGSIFPSANIIPKVMGRRITSGSGARTLATRTAWMAALILCWQGAVSFGMIDSVIVASPLQTLWELKSRLQNGTLLVDTYWTLRRLFIGFVVASIAGVAVGYVMATYKAVENALDWPVQALRSISPLALVPLTVMWFGFGETQKYVLIAITVFFPVLMNVYAAVRGVPVVFVKAAYTLGCRSAFLRFYRVILPATLPHIIEGLRVGLGIGFLVIIAAEMIGASRGLGYLVFHSGQAFDTPAVFVGIVTIAVLGVVADRLILLLKRKLVPWEA